MSTERPIQRVQVGPVEVAIWKNISQQGNVWFSMTMKRKYKDANGDLQSTDSLSRDDVFPAMRALERGYDAVMELQTQARRMSPNSDANTPANSAASTAEHTR